MKGVIFMIGGQWVKIPCKLLADERATRADIIVFGYIADRLGQKTAAIPIADIVRVCEVPKRTVIDCIARLEQGGYIRADKRPGKPTVYTQLVIEGKKPQKEQQRPWKREKPDNSDGIDIEKYKIFINNVGYEESEEQA